MRGLLSRCRRVDDVLKWISCLDMRFSTGASINMLALNGNYMHVLSLIFWHDECRMTDLEYLLGILRIYQRNVTGRTVSYFSAYQRFLPGTFAASHSKGLADCRFALHLSFVDCRTLWRSYRWEQALMIKKCTMRKNTEAEFLAAPIFEHVSEKPSHGLRT